MRDEDRLPPPERPIVIRAMEANGYLRTPGILSRPQSRSSSRSAEVRISSTTESLTRSRRSSRRGSRASRGRWIASRQFSA